jgi:type I restriction enzyme S subunit
MSSNWETVTIIESGINIIDGDRGKNYPKQNEFSQKGYCIFLSTNDIENNKINISNCQYISKDKDALLGKGKIEYLDIILTTRGNGVGKLGLYDYKIPARINSGQVIIRNDTSDFDTKYLFHYLTSTMFKNQIISSYNRTRSHRGRDTTT